MQNEKIEVENEILYIKIRKLLIILLISLIDYSSIIYIYIYVSNISINLLGLSYLIGSCCTLMIMRSTNKIYDNKYLNLIRVIYIIISLKIISNNVFDYKVSGFFEFTKYEEILNKSIIFFLVGVLYIFSKKYLENINKGTKWYVCLITMLIIVITTTLRGGHLDLPIILLNLTTVAIIIKSKKIFNESSLIINKQINFVGVSIYLVYSICFFNLLGVVLKRYTIVINIITNGISFIGFITTSVVIIDVLMNNPQKGIFRQYYKENIQLKELNNKIIIQNRELELSQILINKNEKVIKSFFRNIPIALIFIDKSTRRITFANRNFMILIGEINLKKIINKKYDSFFQIEVNDQNKEMEFLTRATILINGEIKYVSVEAIEESHNQEEIIISFIDITEKIKSDKMKESLKNRLFEEKIKSDFLSNISHDLKTPVNVIYSASQLIDIYTNECDYKGIVKYNKISKENCISLTKFTNNLIDRSKIFSENLSPNLKVMNIVEVIEKTVSTLVDYAKNKNIDLIFDTEEEDIYVKIDCDFMQRIILNIISNSIKYCKDEGKIFVMIKNENHKIRVTIEDNGIGMDEEFLMTACSRYSMGENNRESLEKGTGIGLFVVKKLVEGQGGQISINSKINEGTKTELIFNKVVEF